MDRAFFFADIVEWTKWSIVLEHRISHCVVTQRHVRLEDVDGFARLLGRKRKHVWVVIVDNALQHVAWVDGRRGGTELNCSRDTNKWYRRH